MNINLSINDDNVSLLKLYQQIINDSDLSKDLNHCREINDVSLDYTENENVLKQLDINKMSESVSDNHDLKISSKINYNDNDRYDNINKNLVSIYSISDSIINENVINIDLKQLFLFSSLLFII